MEKKSVIDVVGLEKDSNGRSCEEHKTYGASVELVDTLIVTKCTVSVKESQEQALAVYQFKYNKIGCRVGSIPKYLIGRSNDGMILRILLLYSRSTNTQDRSRSYRHGEMALFSISKTKLLFSKIVLQCFG